MNRNQWATQIREKLGNYPSDMDTEAFWRHLEPQIPHKKKRRTGLWWWISSGLMILVLAAVWWFGGRHRADKSRLPDVHRELSEIAEITSPAPMERSVLHPPKAPEENNTSEGAQEDLSENSRLQQRLSPEAVVGAEPELISAPEVPGQVLPDTPMDVEWNPYPVIFLPSIASSAAFDQQRTALFFNKKRKKKEKPVEGLTQISTGVGAVSKSFRLNREIAADYLEARSQTERPLEFLNTGLMGGIRHRSGFYALSGLHFTRIEERFSFSNITLERDTLTNGVVEIIIAANGDSTFLYGDVPIVREITYRKRSYNSYSFWDVPVVIGYEWKRGRWSWAAEAGFFVNIALSLRGNILHETGNIISMEEAGIFRTHSSLSYQTSARLAYAPGKQLQIYVAPTLRILPASLTLPEYALQQRYSLYGMSVGLIRKF